MGEGGLGGSPDNFRQANIAEPHSTVETSRNIIQKVTCGYSLNAYPILVEFELAEDNGHILKVPISLRE